VVDQLERLRGTHFDPRLVDAFLPLARELHREWFQKEDAPPRAA
jgi:response regulator RpfG family c-di-GMP phosphodiesterase